MSRRWPLIALALWSGCLPALAETPAPTRQRAGEVDTEHLFGQTVGADTEEPGAFVPHFVLPSRLGRRSGSFAVTSPTLELKYGVMENFSGSVSLRGLTANTHNVPGMADTRGAFATGFGIQGRYRFLDRERAPFGMTLQLSATTDQRNMATGERGRSDQLEGRLAFDIEPIWDRLLFAGNIIMASGRNYVSGSGGFEMTSNAGVSLSGATRITDSLWLGAEVIYQRAYTGSTFGRFQGDAVHVGPILYAPIEKGWISLSWTTQVAGREVGGVGPLNLRDFERHQFLAVVGRRF
ncbi:hypothetical protein [Phreatobacter oligotrophus]|uniref:hypothetical protein n=1 Tax=Phreatobacter oligotrophus TaxID=1122261 RepID=UPI002352AE8E|nr:hypothetical protein [Phreatobacter oligotrophus]MBX9991380.1 hypothetical protein [Phreatobacter oligotrophus]